MNVLVALLLFFIYQPVLAYNYDSIVGEAYDVDGNRLLYKEFFSSTEQNTQVTVEYKTKDNVLIAKKQLDFSTAKLAPNCQQEDYRNGEQRSAIKDANSIRVSYRANKSSATQVKTIKQRRNGNELVIDAGFNSLVEKYWLNLLAGEAITFDYLLPTRKQLVALNIKKFSATQPLCEAKFDTKSQHICFKVTAQSWLFRLLMQPLWLVYDMETARLLRFTGLSNLNSDDGEGQRVTIFYSYHDNNVTNTAATQASFKRRE